MKPTIIAIVGESGSGKTTMSLYLQKHWGITSIVSYTTRPMREDEVNGVDHYFVGVKDMPPCEDMIAYTYFAGNHYWATIKQVKDADICSYVIDEKGLIALQKRWKDEFDIIAVNITRPDNPTDDARKERDSEREPYDDYQFHIINDSTLGELYETASYVIGYITAAKTIYYGTERR